MAMFHEKADEEDIVNHYITYTKAYIEQMNKKSKTCNVTKRIIRSCKDKNELKEYLGGEKKEFVFIMEIFDQKESLWDCIESER